MVQKLLETLVCLTWYNYNHINLQHDEEEEEEEEEQYTTMQYNSVYMPWYIT